MQSKNKGLLWILLWCLTFTCGMSTSKFLSASTNSFSLFCVRYLSGMIFFAPFLIPKLPYLSKLKTSMWLHLARAICIGTASLLTYLTYRNLPLAVATSIGFTGPLLASSFGIFLLKEKPSLPKIIALILGYLGVLFIVQPSAVAPINLYALTGIGSCILAGAAIAIARKLSQNDPATVIMLTTTLSLGIVALVGFYGFCETINPFDFKLLLLVGMFGSFSQFAYIKAVSFAEVSFVTPFEYSRLLIAIPIGYFIFAETINPGQIFGIALIVIGSLYLSRSHQELP